MDMFDRLKQHTRGRQEPTTMLFKTLRHGLLYHLGLWLYHDYIISDTHRRSLGGEYRLWYLEYVIELLGTAASCSPVFGSYRTQIRPKFFGKGDDGE